MSAEKLNAKNIYYPPGGILIWIVVFIELITFMMALTVFVFQRNADLVSFRESQQLLNSNFGLLNTILLITAGFFMAECVSKLKDGEKASSFRNLIIAIVLGSGFLITKFVEYYHKIDGGVGLEYSDFFMYYWLLTGFHFVHVLAGIVILVVLSVYLRKGLYNETNTEDVETGAVFWHMCDLIWLILFPLLYLL